jgi:hypothetical protein
MTARTASADHKKAGSLKTLLPVVHIAVRVSLPP